MICNNTDRYVSFFILFILYACDARSMLKNIPYGINLKKIFGEAACSIFIMPPSVEELQKRLEGRGTDSAEVIAKRVAKAEFEISKSPEFDHKVINDDLATAVADTRAIIDNFLKK